MTYRTALAGAALFALAACASGEPPTETLANARNAVNEAQAADAGRLASTELSTAQEKLARAQVLAEDGEYEAAAALAESARADANAALARATRTRSQDTESALAEQTARNAELTAQLAELQAQQTERGAVVTLGDVLFETDRATLTTEGLARVSEIAAYLQANPGEAVVIEGHADARGASAYNQALSERRAETVASVLLAQGIATPRLVYTGLGEDSPIASNDTPFGQSLNRRVEVVFVDRG